MVYTVSCFRAARLELELTVRQDGIIIDHISKMVLADVNGSPIMISATRHFIRGKGVCCVKIFTKIAIVCDHTLVEHALALRGVLESFRLHVDFYRFVQAQQVTEFFATPPKDYAVVVIVCHGSGDDSAPHLRFEVVDQENGDYQSPTGWNSVLLEWTPDLIRQHVGQGFRTILCLACGGGRVPLAEAFLDAGCDAYVGAVSPYIDMSSADLFTLSFFYWLLAEDRDYYSPTYSTTEVVDRAKQFDATWEFGTQSFHLYTRRPQGLG